MEYKVALEIVIVSLHESLPGSSALDENPYQLEHYSLDSLGFQALAHRNHLEARIRSNAASRGYVIEINPSHLHGSTRVKDVASVVMYGTDSTGPRDQAGRGYGIA